MTEVEWLSCKDDPTPMLDFLGPRASSRLMRLFACACIRRIYYLLKEECSRIALEVAERFADGQATAQECEGVLAAVMAANESAGDFTFQEGFQYWKPATALTSDAFKAALAIVQPWMWKRAGLPDELEMQCRLLRDIFGNPFRRVAIDPSWLTWNVGMTPQLAQTIYDERRFQDLPVLADALEEAGCTNAAILAHCRQPGEHVRGCWVVDLLLGKE
jgi:hypothetical protein